MSTTDRAGLLWTPEEEDELIDLVIEQSLTLLYDPRLAWFRVSVQLDKQPWECRRQWLCIRRRRREAVPSPYYIAQETDEAEMVLIP